MLFILFITKGFKCFIGYLENAFVKPLCIILPQMDEYIKYFENGRKNMSFLIKDEKCGINAVKFGMQLKIY